jgi:hypothetical protein
MGAIIGFGVLGRDIASGGARFERVRMGRMGGLALGGLLRSIAEAGRDGEGAELVPLT